MMHYTNKYKQKEEAQPTGMQHSKEHCESTSL